MMRSALWLLLLAAVAAAYALIVRQDQGFVLVVYPPWRIETTIPLAVGALLLLFALGYVLVRLVRTTFKLPGDVRAWRLRRRRELASGDLAKAVAALISGQPYHARKLAERALNREHSPLAGLVAARAAAEQGDTPGARRHLDAAPSEEGELIAARQSIERLIAEREAKADQDKARPE